MKFVLIIASTQCIPVLGNIRGKDATVRQHIPKLPLIPSQTHGRKQSVLLSTRHLLTII